MANLVDGKFFGLPKLAVFIMCLLFKEEADIARTVRKILIAGLFLHAIIQQNKWLAGKPGRLRQRSLFFNHFSILTDALAKPVEQSTKGMVT